MLNFLTIEEENLEELNSLEVYHLDVRMTGAERIELYSLPA